MALQSNADLRLLNGLLPVISVILSLFLIFKLSFINIRSYQSFSTAQFDSTQSDSSEVTVSFPNS